jgi:hypothetical protein
MEFRPVDLPEIFGILSAASIIGLPLLGLTIRFALKPLLDSYARAFPTPLRSAAELERLERRVTELEQALALAALPLPGRERMMAQRSELPRT